MLAPNPTAVHLLAVASLLWTAGFWYGKTHFYRDPGSAFYDESRAFTRFYSVIRERQSTRFLEFPDVSVKASQSASLCVSFQSVRREGQQPLDLAISSALEGLYPQERADIHLSAFIAHTTPSDHPSWHKTSLRDLADDFHSYDVTSTKYNLIEEYERTRDYGRKGILDYVYGLEHCLNATQAPWIAMFEDDVIFADGWLAYTLNSLSNLEAKLKSDSSRRHKWMFLRLFNQERSTGWASKNIGGNHEGLISLAIAVPVIAAVSALRRRFRRARKYMDNWTLMILCLVVLPAFVVLFFQAGKASLLPPRSGISVEGFGCCSQGLVFPRDIVPRVIEKLRDHGSGQIDLILNDMADQERLAIYAQYPVMLQHLGSNSVRGTKNKEAQAVWSMAFETLSPPVLHQQHLEMTRRRYGGV